MRSFARATSRIALAALLIPSAACDQPPSPEATESASQAATAPAPAPGAPTTIADVTWPPAARLDRAALRLLPKAASAAVRGSSVPVLVPTRRDLLAAPVVVAKEHWTSFWARTPEITVSLSMTRLARRYPGIKPMTGAQTVRGLPAFVTTNEGVWSAAWIENGVSYALDLECASPGDAACASDAALLELAAELVYVGGAGAPSQGDVPR